MNEFDIIEYLSGLTGYVFDIAVLKRVAMDRNVYDVKEYSLLTSEQKDLLRADLLYTAYTSPNVLASSTNSHGSYSKTIGSQTISAEEKERLYNSFKAIYKKYDDDKLQEIEDTRGQMQWLDIF